MSNKGPSSVIYSVVLRLELTNKTTIDIIPDNHSLSGERMESFQYTVCAASDLS